MMPDTPHYADFAIISCRFADAFDISLPPADFRHY